LSIPRLPLSVYVLVVLGILSLRAFAGSPLLPLLPLQPGVALSLSFLSLQEFPATVVLSQFIRFWQATTSSLLQNNIIVVVVYYFRYFNFGFSVVLYQYQLWSTVYHHYCHCRRSVFPIIFVSQYQFCRQSAALWKKGPCPKKIQFFAFFGLSRLALHCPALRSHRLYDSGLALSFLNHVVLSQTCHCCRHVTVAATSLSPPRLCRRHVSVAATSLSPPRHCRRHVSVAATSLSPPRHCRHHVSVAATSLSLPRRCYRHRFRLGFFCFHISVSFFFFVRPQPRPVRLAGARHKEGTCCHEWVSIAKFGFK